MSETSDSFSQELKDVVLKGCKLKGIALGIKLDLFRLFKDSEDAVTSEDLARRADCKERYIREWLRHMVVCDVIDADPSGKFFSLPDHRREVLLNDEHIINLMGPALSTLCHPQYELLECFRRDGPTGLAYEKVKSFFDERTVKNGANLRGCAETVVEKVPGLRAKLESGIKVLEIGSGNGELLIHMASKFGRSSFTGVDLTDSFLDKGRRTVAQRGLTNVTLLTQDATELPQDWSDTFDFVVIRDVLHDMGHTSQALASVRRVLRRGGQLAVFEVAARENIHDSAQDPQVKTVCQMSLIISTYHCLPAANYYPGSEALGAGAGVEVFERMLLKAGFEFVEKPKHADFFNMLFIVAKPQQ